MEASVDHIERDTADIKAEMLIMRANARGDFRLLLGAIVTAASGSPPFMAKGFHRF